jgi:anti-sigma regulatory factor (Ser/Thr protein kinase)
VINNKQLLTEQSLCLPAAPEELTRVHEALGRLWLDLEGLVDERPTKLWQYEFEIAVVEVATNVIEHAYGANNTGPMQIRLLAYPDRFEALLIDEGRPWEQSGRQPQSVATAIDIPESGYGLALAYATVDEVQYARTEAGRNEWHLVKHLVDHVC